MCEKGDVFASVATTAAPTVAAMVAPTVAAMVAALFLSFVSISPNSISGSSWPLLTFAR